MLTIARTLATAVVLIAALALAAPAGAAVYAGETVQRAPIVITIDKKGAIKTIGAMWTAQCTSGKVYDFGRVLVSAKKKPSVIRESDNPLFAKLKGGKLTATALGSSDFGGGFSGAITHKITAKLKPGKATGTIQGRVTVLDGSANKVDSCDTGKLRFELRRGPTIYGGSTTQGDPVVLFAKPDRTRVDLFNFGWQASCTPDGFWHLAEEFGNFPLTGTGAFGDTFTNDYPFSDGSGKNSFTYTLDGTLGKKVASGTLSVHMVSTDAAGTAQQTCDTNSVKWSVSQ